MTVKISPSMMCARLNDLPRALQAFADAGVELLHIDVMDGVFVPNYALGTDFVKQLRAMSAIPLDIHLMVERPEDKLHWFDPRPGDYVSVHAESTKHLHRALTKIKETGAKPIAAINPGTHYETLEYVLGDIDAVLVMTVDPGYAGQALVEGTIKKITDLRNWLYDMGYTHIEIEADGNVSFANARRMRTAGANMFVAGSSSVFRSDMELPDAIRMLRESIF